jgi:hypothetical protein
MRILKVSAALAAVLLSGCVAQGQFEPDYLAKVAPPYLAETKIVILMHDHDQQLTFEGRPASEIGENVTLTMPLGAILREVSASVFRSYFMYGVVFTEELVPGLLYVIALEPELRNFSFRYDRHLEEGSYDFTRGGDGLEGAPVSIITPVVQFELALKVHDRSGKILLDKVYESGEVQGEGWIVTSRPHEHVSETFHKALQDIMLKVADDIRPFLAEEEIDPNE